jgi:hypothetical protein
MSARRATRQRHAVAAVMVGSAVLIAGCTTIAR